MELITMIDFPNFSQDEISLLLELLHNELKELPVEIHHCRVASFRQDLRRRKDAVTLLVERLQALSHRAAISEVTEPEKSGLPMN